MASGDRQSMSSVFDDMLRDTWRELDDLYDRPAKPAATPRSQAAATPASAPAPRRPEPSNVSEPERFLNDRYGDGWRQEIVEKKRDGDEVVVLAKLVIDAHDIVKTQFGRARIAGRRGGVAGTSGGVRFAMGEGRGSRPGATAEANAYAKAAADALAKCVAIL